MRFAALLRLEELAERVSACGGALHLVGVDASFARLLDRARSKLPYALHDPEPLASVRACLAHIATQAANDGSDCS